MKALKNSLGVLLLLGLLLRPSPSLWGHGGGGSARPEIISPEGLVQVTDETVNIKWSDGDEDPVAVHHFFYQETNSTPEPVPEVAHLNGSEFFDVAVNDSENTYTWDLSGVAQGTYFLYIETRDPPNCPTIRFANSLIVVDRKEAAPPLSGMRFESPGRNGLVIDTSGALVLRAIAPTQPSIRVSVGYTAADYESEPDNSPCLFQRSRWVEDLVIAEDLTMEADPDAGPGFWRAHIDWDTSKIPTGAFLPRATLKIEGLKEKDIFAPGWISIYHPAGLSPDAAESDASGGEASGCTSSRRASNQPVWLFVLALLFLGRCVLRVQQER